MFFLFLLRCVGGVGGVCDIEYGRGWGDSVTKNHTMRTEKRETERERRVSESLLRAEHLSKIIIASQHCLQAASAYEYVCAYIRVVHSTMYVRVRACCAWPLSSRRGIRVRI